MPHDPRADWLYLLPIGPGATAADLGCEGGELTLALSRLCERVIAVEPDPLLARAANDRLSRCGADNVRVVCAGIDDVNLRPGSFDVVVCQQPERVFGGLARAVDVVGTLVSPQGCAAVAVGAGDPGGRATSRRGERLAAHASRGRFRLAALARALLETGRFRDVTVLAALPGPRAPVSVFPVDQLAACRSAVSHFTSAGAPREWLLRAAVLRAAACVAGPGASRALLPGFWVVARSPANFRAPMAEEMVRSIVAQRPSSDVPRTDPSERARSALRNRPLAFASLGGAAEDREHATCLAFPQGWREPACVLRIGRSQASVGALTRTGEALHRLRARAAPELREGIPTPMGAAVLRGHGVLAESHLDGVTLQHRILSIRRGRVRSLVERVLPMTAEWLADLNLQTASRGWIQGEECERMLRRLLGGGGLPEGQETGLQSAMDSGAPAGRLPGSFDALLPAVAEAGTRFGAAHNRVSPRSVLLRPSGIAVLDWSGITFDDLPLADLYSLVTSLGGLLLQRCAAGSGTAVGRGVCDAADAAVGVFAFTFAEETWYSRQVAGAIRRYCDRAGLPLATAHLLLPLAYLRMAAQAGREDPKGDETAASFRLASLALEWQPGW